ncbi:PLAC8-domain-containing protein [Aspergillus sclerotiicarbonarius CBS 121057]|uniref:PLAC8-domain-containing protein n=1 Tax=Aspergillus sclerotiicarbonarius (strain CBS 121057 / IBT 28362) TaxID=1448318 RepID=A0A319E0L0_ASPSB|nr:PLAC8-domain-containing protein [Aspergillus sclerotiicarbonarius CBS 121057]
MADTQKGYRAWPSTPPTYDQANSEEIQSVTYNKDWNYSLCDCCSPASLCLTSCCLPGLTFGKTQARLQNPKLENYSSCNGECSIFTLLTFTWTQWIVQTIRRGEMRQRYGIKGSCCSDCCVTFWCGCCALTQEEKEMELRTRPELAGYQMAPEMAYSK